LTADGTLFDFARGALGKCESTVSSAQDWEPNESATVDVTGATTWAGDVSFTLHEGLDCTGPIVYGPESAPVSDGTPTVATSNDDTFVAEATQD